ncbi:MAG: hypothetical protein K2O03_14445 [Lachnospiraceae bacterium]|nr:hypothetical protein [Lachnospiraceae bacterium]
MAKKAKKQQKEKQAAENYYDLKVEAVDRLVNAKSAPKVSEKEIRKYTSKGKFHIPSWLKILFVKFWFSGAICYFFLWGMGLYLAGLDLMVVLAIALGVSTDLMVNHLLHSFEPEKGEYDKWMMIPFRRFWTIFLNVIYAGVLLYCVIQIYAIINTILVGDVNEAETVALGVEPLLFGIFYMAMDMLFVTIKNTLVKIFREANEKVNGTSQKDGKKI